MIAALASGTGQSYLRFSGVAFSSEPDHAHVQFAHGIFSVTGACAQVPAANHVITPPKQPTKTQIIIRILCVYFRRLWENIFIQ